MTQKYRKLRHVKAATLLPALLLAFCSFTACADNTTPGSAAGGQAVIDNITNKTAVATGGGAASVKARVEFRQAASYSVAHDPIDLHTATEMIDIDHAVTNEAHITIGSLKGETVLMTCGVSGGLGKAAYTRDCDGGNAVKTHPIEAGHSVDDGILLTKDLLPNPTGASNGSVSIVVTYP